MKFPVKNLLTFLILALPAWGTAQVLSNPDFEDDSNCPTALGQIPLLDNWEIYVQSADYYNCGFVSGIFPEEVNGASSGTGYTGFATYGDGVGSAEAIGQELPAPLVAGEEYTFVIDIKMANGGVYSDVCTGLCIYGFMNEPASVTGNHISNQAGAVELACTEIVDNTLWETYTLTFTASDDFTYLVFSPGLIPSCTQCFFMDNVTNEDVPIIEDIDYCAGESLELTSPFGSNTTWYEVQGATQTEVGTGSTIDINPVGNMQFIAINDEGEEATFNLTEISYPVIPDITAIDPTEDGVCDGSIDFELEDGFTLTINGDDVTLPYNNLCEGSYLIEISNGDCSSTENIILSSSQIEDIDYCEGDEITLDSPYGSQTTWYEVQGATQTEVGTGSQLDISPVGDVQILAVGPSGDEAFFNLTEVEVPAFPQITATDPSEQGACDGSIDFALGGGLTLTLDNQPGTPPFTGLCEGTYTLEISNGTCSSTTTVTLSTEPPCTSPQLSLVEVTDERCGDETGSIEVLAVGDGVIDYQLVGETGWQSEPLFENLASGNYVVEARADGECISQLNVSVDNFTDMSVGLVSLENVDCPGNRNGSVEVEVINGIPPYTFNLNTFAPQDFGIYEDLAVDDYYLTVTDSQGCEALYEFKIRLEINESEDVCFCDFFIPNSMTPDGDDLNEVWKPVPSCPILDFDLKIFNRWGDVVFETTDPDAVWDGDTGSGYFAPNAVYAYRLSYRWGVPGSFNPELVVDTGTITVIR